MPFLSSKRIALALPYAPPLLERDRMPALRRVGRQVPRRHLLGVVDAAGDERLVRVAFEEVDDHLLADARDVRSTPQFLPAHGCDTRTQHELFSFFLPSRSQWNCTFTRPYLSVKISSPAGPTTTAVCGPCTNGFGVRARGPELLRRRDRREVAAELARRVA